MKRMRLLWQLYPSYLLITLTALLAAGWYVSETLHDFHVKQTTGNLLAQARLVRYQLVDNLAPEQAASIDALVKKLGSETATRITVVLADGLVLGDSEKDPRLMDNHAGRVEIRAALAGRIGVSTRFSRTLGQEMMYVAVPIVEGGRISGSVRTAIAVTAINRTLKTIYGRLLLGGLVVALLAAAVSLFVSRRITRPLELMKRSAERFARGELDSRLPVAASEEIGGLAEAMNRMAAHLDDRIKTVLRQRNEQDAVLSSMVEGVLAVDTGERIMRLNRAAATLLAVQHMDVGGRPIQEVVRKADLQRFVTRTLQSRQHVEGDISLVVQGEERHLQAHGTVLRDAAGQEIGALVVLNDVTRLRRLESMRRDFVANVSHELKTPITAIKGSVETLQAGAVENPEDARRFLGIVSRQADRLNAIIEDLLALSRIEQGVEQGGLPQEEGSLKEVLGAAVQSCSVSAAEKSIDINLVCDEALRVRINAPLLEQAVVNLLTNAIKYSNSGKKIIVDASRFEGKVMIKVQDFGCGIDPVHLPRLFERFYRVDQARSRKLGGTGLGLAIVKHIAQAHGGLVHVASTPGEGSTFTIILPVD
jgi:two-component system phosphate regulon sensor histidine kinase PhoR